MNYNIYYYFIVGILDLIFGIIKTIICILNIITNKKNIEKLNNNKYLKYIIEKDISHANKIFFIIILFFSIYTFIKGLIYLKFIKIKKLSHDYHLYIGILLILIYGFIIYLPNISKKIISRDDNNINIYKSIYFGSGFFFILTYILYYIYDNKNNISSNKLIFLSIIIILLILILFKLGSEIIYENYIKEINTLIMIPIGII